MSKLIASFLVCFLFISSNLCSQGHPVKWRDVLKQERAWYGSEQAIRIADNVVLYQHRNGGWTKNTDLSRVLDEKAKEALLSKKDRGATTIDNKASFTQLKFLAKVYDATRDSIYKRSFEKGVDFLFEAQYPNGGWPQFYPLRKGYYEHITYNDGAMIGVMHLLRDIAESKTPYEFVDSQRKAAAATAIAKGLDIILKTQVVVDGELTVWCAQHDKDSFRPAKARAYELPSLSGGESTGIVLYLMSIEDPSAEVIKAIEAAVRWMEHVKITGKRVEVIKDPKRPGWRDRIVVNDSTAPALWARFYEIGTNKPMFVGRDGIVKEQLSEIEHERRIGYSYLVRSPALILEEAYPRWKAKIAKQ